jgi:arylsulfatase
MIRDSPSIAPHTYNRSFRITADVDLPEDGAQGALIALGGVEGGWSFSIQDGKLVFHYNWVLVNQYKVASDAPAPTGKVTLVADFAYDGGGMGKGATVTLSANGTAIGSGRIDQTTPLLYGTDGFDIGGDYGSAVSPDYTAPFVFTGTLEQVTIDLL